MRPSERRGEPAIGSYSDVKFEVCSKVRIVRCCKHAASSTDKNGNDLRAVDRQNFNGHLPKTDIG